LSIADGFFVESEFLLVLWEDNAWLEEDYTGGQSG